MVRGGSWSLMFIRGGDSWWFAVVHGGTIMLWNASYKVVNFSGRRNLRCPALLDKLSTDYP